MNNRIGNQGAITPAILNLIIINAILFIASIILGSTYHINVEKLLGLHFPLNSNFKIWQIVTHMFMHADIFHIFLNMLSLWMFGTVLEKVWGAKRFLIFYFVCGFGAAICYLGVEYYNYLQVIKSADFFLNHPTANTLLIFLNKNSLEISDELMNQINFWKANPNNIQMLDSFKHLVVDYKQSLANMDSRFASPMIGASGAVYGVLLGYGYLFPNTIIYFQLFIPIKAKYLVFIYAGIELFSTWRHVPGDNIAHVAHLGGMLFGFILIFFWNKQNRNTFY
jgi:membrane associated rhomboid family serine protease